jgi:chromate reductase
MDEDNSPSLPPRKILGIAGSLRQASYNCAALRAAQELAPKGCAIEVFNRAGIPPFNQGEEGNPPARVLELKAAVRVADAILLVTRGIQLFDSGRVQERHRLGVAPVRREGKPVAVMGA